MNVRDDTGEKAGGRLDWYSRRRPPDPVTGWREKLELKCIQTQVGGKGRYKNGMWHLWFIVALPTRVAVSSSRGWKQAASWCRCLESSAEMRYERWLGIQHEGPQREWSRMSVYSPKHLDRLLVFHTLSTWRAPVPLWLSEIHLSPSALLSLSQLKKQTKNLKAAVSETFFSLKNC